MPPAFGTSGLRGLVSELTPELVAGHVRAFLAACEAGPAVEVGRDLRASSPAIARVVIAALKAAGVPAIDQGVLPTPALALSALRRGHGAIMVTGSHIPADRNGLKFYTPRGEITKADEAAIRGALEAVPGEIGQKTGQELGQENAAPAGSSPRGRFPETAEPAPAAEKSGEGQSEAARNDDAESDAAARWWQGVATAWGPAALAGLTIGVWQHSSVARDLLPRALEAMGARVIPLARSETFIPVDTEAVDPGTRARLAAWCAEHRLDALVSTDGDGDRPLVTDARGEIVPGDVLGPLAARALGAEILVTPVSANTAVEALGFARVIRTKIGSPFVLAGMEGALAEDPAARVAGYEPNGGFLLGFAAGGASAGSGGPSGPLPPLMTRDCLVPIVAPLAAARAAGTDLAGLVAALPARFTASDRLQGVAPEVSAPFLERLAAGEDARVELLSGLDLGPQTGLDRTDGLRLTFGERIVHLRPSGNAPEFRLYAEAGSAAAARDLVVRLRDRLAARLG